MTKKISSLLILLVVFLAIPAYATSPRLVDILPNITFSNNEATCTVEIYADKSNDQISGTMELWQGNNKIGDWSACGIWYLSMEETVRVEAGKTYKLVVNYSVNGVSKAPVTIYRTNS